MKSTTSLCFSQNGFLNPESLSFIINKGQEKGIDGVVFFTDGSEEAFNHLKNFDLTKLPSFIKHKGLGKLPLYELRLIKENKTPTHPHYVYSEDDRVKWFCYEVCPYFIKLIIIDITSQVSTEVELSQEETGVVCYFGYRIWSLLTIAEERLLFPASVMDKLMRYTYQLTPNTIDIPVLRKETGITSLNYNTETDLLSILLNEDIFEVKLSVLNEFYGKFILPEFNAVYGRRLHIKASILDTQGKQSSFTSMGYGQLGSIVTDLKKIMSETYVSKDNPIAEEDLISFSKRVKISNDTCHWLSEDQDFKQAVDNAREILVREYHDPDQDDLNIDGNPEETLTETSFKFSPS